MNNPVTVIAPIKLAAGKTEADLLLASERFQKDFVNGEPGVLRRELLRSSDGNYIDIVQFRSAEDAEDVMKKEQESAACHAFFSIMDMENDAEMNIELLPSLATYT